MKSNKKILEKYGAYHDTSLLKLQADPGNTRIVLKSTPVTNLVRKLAENDKFKTHIYKQLYNRIAKVYFAHDDHMDHMSEAAERMTELNIFGNFYMLAGGAKDWTEEEMQMFQDLSKSGGFQFLKIELVWRKTIGSLLITC